MRATMKKQFVKTEIHVSTIKVENGEQKIVQLDPIKKIGAYSKVKAQRVAEQKYGKGVKVTEIKAKTEDREMPTMKFYELSTPCIPGVNDVEEDSE